jgi:hypothetical protein
MRRRKLRWALAGLAAVLTGIAILLLQPKPSPRISKENFDRLYFGMSGREVDALLGPPGDYRTGPTRPVSPPKVSVLDPLMGHRPRSMPGAGPWRYVWETDSERITITLEPPADYYGLEWDYFGVERPWSDGMTGRDGITGRVQVSWYECMTSDRPLNVSLDWVKRQWHRWFP